ncbi:MAG TPA: IS200/IS605 family transposase [Cyclobacteriaceae bacterium]
MFAVKTRISLIQSTWKEELYKYITGIVQSTGHKMLAINGMPDHIHMFFGMRPTESLSDLMQRVKANSSSWINKSRFVKGKFEWQEGFGGFSYSKSHVTRVIKYIQNQELHHKKRTFLQEYVALLDAFEVPYDERYIFKEPY